MSAALPFTGNYFLIISGEWNIRVPLTSFRESSSSWLTTPKSHILALLHSSNKIFCGLISLWTNWFIKMAWRPFKRSLDIFLSSCSVNWLLSFLNLNTHYSSTHSINYPFWQYSMTIYKNYFWSLQITYLMATIYFYDEHSS